VTAKYSMTRSTRGLSATAELLVLFVAAITDPRPGHDFGRQHQFNYDYSYWSLTVSFNQHCLMSSLLSVIRNFNIQNILCVLWIRDKSLIQVDSLLLTCVEWSAFIIHHAGTVPEQTKDKTISLSLRDVTWRFRDC